VAEKPKRTKRSYTTEQVEAGLHALAISNGSEKIASYILTEGGYDIPHATLQGWKKQPKHQARLAEIEATVVPRVRERMAAESEALAIAYAHIERKALDLLEPRLHELRPAELAGVQRNIATSRAISVDKSSVLRGMPTEITEHRNADEVLRKLGASLPGLIVEGTVAEEGKQIGEASSSPNPSAPHTDADK
jgi:hypothetical protein